MKTVEPRLIADIRYFESNRPNSNGSSLPGNIGTIFSFPEFSNLHGVRIARKLREIGFQTGNFDHVYINFTTELAERSSQLSPRTVYKEDAWFRYIDYGLLPENLNRLPELEKSKVILRATFEVLRFISAANTDSLAKIEEVSSLVFQYGDDLEILHKKKEFKKYSLSVIYKIHGPGMRATGILECHDKITGDKRRAKFVELSQYEDIFYLISEMVLKNENVVLKPKISFKAGIYNQRYKVPIVVPLQTLERHEFKNNE